MNLTKDILFNEVDGYKSLSSNTINLCQYVITGDTDSIFICLDEFVSQFSNEDKLIYVSKICDTIENYLNNHVVPNIIENHQVPKKENCLKLKNELVCKRSFFQTKKHYALHIISEEKKKVDEIKVVGIEIRRSDYPSFTKECLKQLLDMILLPEEISLVEILDFVSDKEKVFAEKINQGLKEVARPVSFTKKLDQYKKIPMGVIGMLNWNKLMYNYFLPGTRGYQFKLSGLDEFKAPNDIEDRYHDLFLSKGKSIDVIVIPETEPKLPEYFIPNIQSMLKLAWIDRYKLLINPLKGEYNDQTLDWEEEE